MSEPANVYVLRIWWETSREVHKVWRARVTDAATKAERYFATPEALARFLGLEEPSMTRPFTPPADDPSLFEGGFGTSLELAGNLTRDAYAVLEHSLPPRTLGAPPHKHSLEDEIVYVLEGDLTVQLGDRMVTAAPGSFVLEPRGQFHAFWNAGDVPVLFLVFLSTPGFERYVAELTAFLTADAPPDTGAVAAFAAKYGLEVDLAAVPALLARHKLRLP